MQSERYQDVQSESDRNGETRAGGGSEMVACRIQTQRNKEKETSIEVIRLIALGRDAAGKILGDCVRAHFPVAGQTQFVHLFLNI